MNKLDDPTSLNRLPPVLLTGFAGLLLLGHALWGWIPILDSANLAFHEAGHPLFGLLSVSRWGWLNQDTTLAWSVRFGAVALMIWTLKQAWTRPASAH